MPESQPIVTIRKRNFKKLNLNDFKTRLCQSRSFTEPVGMVDDFVDQIEADVTKILDDLIPERTCKKRYSSKKHCWLSEAAMEAKRAWRRLKPRWLKNKTSENKLPYHKSCKVANKLIMDSLRLKHSKDFDAASDNSRTLWKAVNKL